MNRQTQVLRVRDLLLEDYHRGGKGLNSVDIRESEYIVMVATRVFDNKDYFKSVGLRVEKRLEKNRTATYFLVKDAEIITATKIGEQEAFL